MRESKPDRLLPSLRITAQFGAPASTNVARDLALTRDYLAYLRETMGRAVKELAPFDAAYANTDWLRFDGLPAFAEANRINAWGTHLLLEQEALSAAKP